jgi:hypothetical protein
MENGKKDVGNAVVLHSVAMENGKKDVGNAMVQNTVNTKY